MANPAERPLSAREGFAEAIELLRSDRSRGFAIDVETDTMIFEDQRAERAARIEFIQSVSTFLKEAVPAAQMYPAIAPVLIEMLMFGVRGFKTGRALEAVFEQATDQLGESNAPQTKPDPKMEAEKAKVMADKERLTIDREDKALRQKADLEDAAIRREAEIAHEQRKLDMQIAAEARKIAMQDAAEQRKAMAAQPAPAPDPSMMVSDREKFDLERQKSDREYRLKLAAQNKQVIAEADADVGQGVASPTAEITQALTALATIFADSNRQLMELIAQGQAQQSADSQNIANGLQAIIAHQSAPVVAVRDKAGKVTEVRRGNVTMDVVRGADGRPVGLQ